MQATARRTAIEKAWQYLYNAKYLDDQTLSLEMTFLGFNTRLRTFTTWRLPLTRNPDGRFYGVQYIRHAFETAYDRDTAAGRHRVNVDMALLVAGGLHMLWVIDEYLTFRAENRRVRVWSTALNIICLLELALRKRRLSCGEEWTTNVCPKMAPSRCLSASSACLAICAAWLNHQLCAAEVPF